MITVTKDHLLKGSLGLLALSIICGVLALVGSSYDLVSGFVLGVFSSAFFISCSVGIVGYVIVDTLEKKKR